MTLSTLKVLLEYLIVSHLSFGAQKFLSQWAISIAMYRTIHTSMAAIECSWPYFIITFGHNFHCRFWYWPSFMLKLHQFRAFCVDCHFDIGIYTMHSRIFGAEPVFCPASHKQCKKILQLFSRCRTRHTLQVPYFTTAAHENSLSNQQSILVLNERFQCHSLALHL